MCHCPSWLSCSQNETLTKVNTCLSQSNLLGCGSEVSSCGTAACAYKQFCNKTEKVSDSTTVKTVLHITTANKVTYHSLFLSLPYLQECHPLDKNNAAISKHKYRIAAC